jgi:hypothetical protein
MLLERLRRVVHMIDERKNEYYQQNFINADVDAKETSRRVNQLMKAKASSQTLPLLISSTA